MHIQCSLNEFCQLKRIQEVNDQRECCAGELPKESKRTDESEREVE